MPLDPTPVIAEALKERASRKPRKAKRTRKAKKPRIPKLHRPKKESTKTITTRLYKTWAAIVHSYYNNRCAICGKEHSKEAPLNAHHIMPRQMFSALRFAPENGIALCPKCHKMGRFSAHKGGIWFAEWLRTHDPDRYQYCLTWANEDLDCKDRSALYSAESDLHSRYGDAIAPLPMYDVVAYDRKGNKVQSVVMAYNNRAAEFIFWNSWPKTEIPLKGIHKSSEVTPDDLAHRTAEHFKGINTGYYKPVSEMDEPEFIDYLTETFKGRKMDEDTMHQMTCLFEEYCASHGLDPRLYVLHGDCHGNVSIVPSATMKDPGDPGIK